jgi:hypothetical protein
MHAAVPPLPTRYHVKARADSVGKSGSNACKNRNAPAAFAQPLPALRSYFGSGKYGVAPSGSGTLKTLRIIEIPT